MITVDSAMLIYGHHSKLLSFFVGDHRLGAATILW
jgi:hypothetical protein